MTADSYRHRCDYCGKILPWEKAAGTAWEACGEFGEETRYVCPSCVAKPGFLLIAGNGSRDPRWCGIFGELTPVEGGHAAALAALARDQETGT